MEKIFLIGFICINAFMGSCIYVDASEYEKKVFWPPDMVPHPDLPREEPEDGQWVDSPCRHGK